MAKPRSATGPQAAAPNAPSNAPPLAPSKARSRSTRKSAPKSPAPEAPAAASLPIALAKNAARKAAARRAELVAAARDDIAQIKRRQLEIVEGFYEIGEALLRLRREGVAEALGYAGYAEMLDKEVGMALSRAERLMDIVTHVPRESALRWGKEKSSALVELAAATADLNDSPSSLMKGGLKLSSGRALDLEKASVRDILSAAKAERHARRAQSGAQRGRTTTANERAVAAAIEAALHKRGVLGARVQAMATKPGGVANLRIDGVPMDALSALRAALSKAGR